MSKASRKNNLKQKVTPVYRQGPQASHGETPSSPLTAQKSISFKNKFNILLFTYEHLAAFVDPHLAMEEVEDCLQ